MMLNMDSNFDHNLHPVYNLLCVSRHMVGNYAASKNVKLSFKNHHCAACKSYRFCLRVLALVYDEYERESAIIELPRSCQLAAPTVNGSSITQ